jgi:alanyl-tRNA synthetase
MNPSELRSLYLEFFEKKGHRIMRSDSLVPPSEDKSLLFTGAGMNQFKAEFMGRGEPDLKCATTSQKCLRTGDLDNVGRTAFHHTFFEMLGNFSFGDYFKREAIQFAWEFLVDVLKLPVRNLQVSVYEDDDEAYDIWHKEIGLDPTVIHRFGQHDNFWPADCPSKGPNGLCGPCSEIFYDWGPDGSCTDPNCNPSCDCNRFCEIWNLVFQQFDRQDGGALVPLPTKNIDTGLGFERLTAVMQGKRNNFDSSLFTPIIAAIERETDLAFEDVRDKREGVAFRRIADHVRAAIFCISDGILPGNSGRDYVLRKIIRRAVLDARRLGMEDPMLYRLVPVITKIMGGQYPEVVEQRENIARLIQAEEKRFFQTLDQGMGILQEMMDKVRGEGASALSGVDAFKLFDTYGLPIDVTESVLEDEGLKVDMEGFEKEMEGQREKSRAGTKIAGDIFGGGPVATLREQGADSTFTGYEEDATDARILGMVAGEDIVDTLPEGAEGAVIIDRSPFYAEAGGEVGDTGIIDGEGFSFHVSDTRKMEGLICHIGKVSQGTLAKGANVVARANVARRADIRRNHTATHLLHKALQGILGPHAQQSGSYVGPDRLRFDFTHPQAMTADELRLVEDAAVRSVLENRHVSATVMSLDAARAKGATALFGEKYGDEVRVVEVEDTSMELCGGLHCAFTGEIGAIKIISESSVAAGIRRIEGVTGMAAVKHIHTKEDTLRQVCAALSAQETQAIDKAIQMNQQIKDLRKEVQRARQSAAPSAEDYLKDAKEIGGAKIVAAKIDGATADDLRAIADQLRKAGDGIGIILASAAEGKVLLIVAFTKELVAKGCHAGKIAGAAAKLCGGGGGGRPDMAQAGGKNPDGIPKALEEAVKMAEEMLG